MSKSYEVSYLAQEGGAEEDEPAPVVLYTVPNLQKVLQVLFCRTLTPHLSVGLWWEDSLKDSGYRQPHLGAEEEKAVYPMLMDVFSRPHNVSRTPDCEPLLQRTRNNSQDPQTQYARLGWVLVPKMSLITSLWSLCDILKIFVHL